MNNTVNTIIEQFKNLEVVDIVTLGGSRAGKNHDIKSDYDIYIYSNEPISLEVKKEILNKYYQYIEYNNDFWETEDCGILNCGTRIDIIYRDVDFIEREIDKVFVNNTPNIGYATCLIDNIFNSKVLYDKNSVIESFKLKYPTYPDVLAQKIILKNAKLISNLMPSLRFQIVKALDRGDLISINHRITEFISLYVDVLFALNKKYHKGEKRLSLFIQNFKIKPVNSVQLIEELLKTCMHNPQKAKEIVSELSDKLNNLIKEKYPDYQISNYIDFK